MSGNYQTDFYLISNIDSGLLSAFHSEKYLHLEYFRVHHELAERLKKSGINYSIIKPPAIFSGFLDMIEMAKKGQLSILEKATKKQIQFTKLT